MRYTATIFATLAFAGLFFTPPQVSAQNSKEYKELQREFYDTNSKLDEMKKGQDDRLTALEAALKQMTDANAKLVDQMRALQDKLADSAAQQDKRVIAPLDQMKTSQDNLWEASQRVQGSLDNQKGRLDNIDKNMTTVLGLLGQMQQDISKVAAPPPAPATVSSAPASGADAATIAFATAEADKAMGKLQIALGEFRSIAEAYPSAPQAPIALYEVGMIYADYPQPVDAIKAFDLVLEQFGDNPMRKPAQFKKAEQLAAMGKNAEAAREYTTYAKTYPDDDNAAVAKQRAAELGGSAPAKPKPSSKSKGKR